MTERCPACDYYDGGREFERPFKCDNCGCFFPELAFRSDGGTE
jgi:hypothetical protein